MNRLGAYSPGGVVRGELGRDQTLNRTSGTPRTPSTYNGRGIRKEDPRNPHVIAHIRAHIANARGQRINVTSPSSTPTTSRSVSPVPSENVESAQEALSTENNSNIEHQNIQAQDVENPTGDNSTVSLSPEIPPAPPLPHSPNPNIPPAPPLP